MKRAAGDEPDFSTNAPKRRRCSVISSSNRDESINGVFVSGEKSKSASPSVSCAASVEKGIVNGSSTNGIKNTGGYPEEYQQFYGVECTDTEYEDDIEDEDSEYSESPSEKVYRREEDMARQLGDLVNLRPLVDYSTDIPRANRLPPEFKPSLDDINTFEARFGLGSYEQLDHYVRAICPDPSRWAEGHGYLDNFFGNWTQREPNFAGSELSNFLLPTSSVRMEVDHAAQSSPSLSVVLDQQAALLEKGLDGFLLTSEQDFGSVSALKVADATYSLNVSALSEPVHASLTRSNESTRFPCLHASANRIAPMISVEVKVDGGIQKQTLQQALYGTWSVYRQLIVRFLASTTASPPSLEGIRHYSLGVFDDNLAIWEYTPIQDRTGLSQALRIHARLLCKGSMHDEDWFANTYCAWRRHITKLVIFDHVVSFLPDVDAYAALPPPSRPFDKRCGSVFVLARDFTLGDAVQLDRLSFGSRPSALRADLAERVHAWRSQMGFAKKLKRLSQLNSSRPGSSSNSFSQQSAVAEGIYREGPSARGSAVDAVEVDWGTENATRKKQRAEEPVNQAD